jgi:hypothetical protein
VRSDQERGALAFELYNSPLSASMAKNQKLPVLDNFRNFLVSEEVGKLVEELEELGVVL